MIDRTIKEQIANCFFTFLSLDLIDEADREHEDPQPKLPLIRMRVESANTLPFSAYQFGLRFVDKVANPEDILLFKMKRPRNKGDAGDVDFDKLNEIAERTEESLISNIEDIVKEYFDAAEDEKTQLSMMNEKSVTLAVKGLVDKEDTDAIPELLDTVLTRCRKTLAQNTTAMDDRVSLLDKLRNIKEQQTTVDRPTSSTSSTANGGQQRLSVAKSKPRKKNQRQLDSDEDMTSDDDVSEVISPDELSEDESPRKKGPGSTRGRGRGRGAKSRR